MIFIIQFIEQGAQYCVEWNKPTISKH